MVDIHCHILPGLDDGAKSLETAEEMAAMAIEEGITHVVGTPHSNSEYHFDPELIRQRRDELQARVGSRLRLVTGCDFHLSHENLTDIPSNPAKYTINQKNYLLIEFADFAVPVNAEEIIRGLQQLNLEIIITHPERNKLIRADQDRLRAWVRMGCTIQITAQSLLGRWGEKVKAQVEEWLDQEMVHFFASDAHDSVRRPLRLREAYETVTARHGETRANALFHDNPLATIEGRPLPYRPGAPETARQSRRRRFLFF